MWRPLWTNKAWEIKQAELRDRGLSRDSAAETASDSELIWSLFNAAVIWGPNTNRSKRNI